MKSISTKTQQVSKADVERHRTKEMEEIAELEMQEQTKTNEDLLLTYRNFLNQLQQGKCEVVSKIGRK